MSSHQTLQANKREESGSGAANRLRRDGIVPAVVYGAEQRTYAVQVEARAFRDILKAQSSENFLVNLEIEGAKEKTKLAMVQDIQQDPLSGQLVHIDFHAVRENETVHANLPIELVGAPAGVKNGGVMEQLLHNIEVHCRPADLPEKLELDVTDIEIGQGLHVKDLPLPDGVEVHVDGDVLVMNIAEPRVSDDSTEDAAAESTGEEAAEGGEAAAASAE